MELARAVRLAGLSQYNALLIDAATERGYSPTRDFARMLVCTSDVPPMIEYARELR